jgi:hypothetical protein
MPVQRSEFHEQITVGVLAEAFRRQSFFYFCHGFCLERG